MKFMWSINLCAAFVFFKKRFGGMPPTQDKKAKKCCKNSQGLDTSQEEVKGYLSRGMQLPMVTIPCPHPGIWAGQRRRMLGYNVDEKDGWSQWGPDTVGSSWWGEGRSKERERMGLLLKGIQVLLCNTSQLRTSGKRMYLYTLSLRIVIWARGFL